MDEEAPAATKAPGPIPRQPVSSSNIKSIGYRPTDQTLAVEFMNGHVWHYKTVPPNVHSELMGATSKGAYFAQSIRRKYAEERFS